MCVHKTRRVAKRNNTCEEALQGGNVESCGGRAVFFRRKTLQARPCRSPISNLCTDSSTGRVLVKLWLPAFYSLLQLQQLKVLACGMQSWWATGAGVGGQGSGEALERKLTEKLKRQQIRCCNSQPERLMTAAN